MSISITCGLISFESLDSNSEKIEEIYKAYNCINDIAFGAYLFVLYDLYTYFTYNLYKISFRAQLFKKSTVLYENYRYLRFCKYSSDDNVFKSGR